MQNPTIYIIRHGEKPAGLVQGVTLEGNQSSDSLAVKGWQRAGALIGLFGASSSQNTFVLSSPATIFSACPDAQGANGKDKSRREEETATPLAERLGLRVVLDFGKGQEAAVAKAAREANGPVLIVWDHSEIISLTRALCSSEHIPNDWPSDRFDVVFLLLPDADGYRFMQVPQQLLQGDANTPIA